MGLTISRRLATASVAMLATDLARGAAGDAMAQTFGRTAAELAAGIVPASLAYLPGDVRRYGAAADGVTPDRAAVQAAMDLRGRRRPGLPAGALLRRGPAAVRGVARPAHVRQRLGLRAQGRARRRLHRAAVPAPQLRRDRERAPVVVQDRRQRRRAAGRRPAAAEQLHRIRARPAQGRQYHEDARIERRQRHHRVGRPAGRGGA